MRQVALGDVCQVVSGSTPKRNKPEFWGGTIPWVTPKEISDLRTPYLEDSVEKITDLGYRSCSTTMLPPNSVLLSSRAPIGLLAINKIKVCTNQGFKSLIPSDAAYSEYLYYYLKQNVRALQAKGNGATFKELSKTAVEDFKIPLPPLDDQKRIAYVLGKVEGAIAQRKHHLQQLDDLLKSIFLEMFGDPVRNEKGWELDDFEAITESSRNGLSPSRSGETKGLVYTLSAITGNSFKEIFKEDQFTKTRDTFFPSTDDFLVCRGNGNINLVGKGYFYPGTKDNIMFPDTMIGAKIRGDSINKRFLEHLWKSNFIRYQIEKSARTANGTYKINQKSLSSIKLIFPPNSLQTQFADIVQKVEGIKSRYQQSLADLENLYGALSQKAFKGELDLSRVPLPSDDTDATAAELLETSEPSPQTETFTLPAPPELTTLHSAKGRQALIDHWLAAWLTHFNDAPFSPRPFIEAAQQRLMELAEEEDLPDWSIAEYNSVQAWVFEALGDRHLTQTYDDAKNRVQLHAVGPR
ncbi:MAG: restriction endonuclease subunit S [Cyanobacteria bacterium J06638_20]